MVECDHRNPLAKIPTIFCIFFLSFQSVSQQLLTIVCQSVSFRMHAVLGFTSSSSFPDQKQGLCCCVCVCMLCSLGLILFLFPFIVVFNFMQYVTCFSSPICCLQAYSKTTQCFVNVDL